MTSSKTDHTEDDDVFEWKRMQFKGNKVWLAMADETTPLLRAGKVRVKYNLKQSYEYWVHSNSVIELGENDKVTTASKTKSSKKKATSKAPSLPSETDLPADTIRIYTDGASSGNPGPSGAGAVLLYGEHRKELSKYLGDTTNNVAELTAIQIALTHLKTTTKPVVIYTDSSYALGVLTKGWKAKKNRSLIEKIKKQMNSFETLSFIKVAGHAGIPENERADQLAVGAITKASK